jgi:hypothetical protein
MEFRIDQPMSKAPDLLGYFLHPWVQRSASRVFGEDPKRRQMLIRFFWTLVSWFPHSFKPSSATTWSSPEGWVALQLSESIPSTTNKHRADCKAETNRLKTTVRTRTRVMFLTLARPRITALSIVSHISIGPAFSGLSPSVLSVLSLPLGARCESASVPSKDFSD